MGTLINEHICISQKKRISHKLFRYCYKNINMFVNIVNSAKEVVQTFTEFNFHQLYPKRLEKLHARGYNPGCNTVMQKDQ